MVLECTIICIDNSEWMRNGDYIPTRMEAQHDAANLVSGAKTQQNPESTVGILTMAGKGVELLVSPTDDVGKLLGCLHSVKVGGRADVAGAVQVAHLALKHRRNKHGGKRIVVFVGSPIDDDVKTLIKVGKSLKKESVAIDIISMGEIEENKTKLQEFVDATNSNNNSHLVSIPPGLLPSDVIVTSPIIHGEDGDGGAAMAGFGMGGGAGAGDFGAVDDPALAMALRVSFEEERARQEAAAKAAAAEGGSGGAPTAMDTDSSAAPLSSDMDEDEEELLRQALAMSMTDSTAATAAPAPMETEDDEMQRALQMSMQESSRASPAPAPAPATTASSSSGGGATAAAVGGGGSEAPQFMDPEYVKQLLGSLQGVDASHPSIKAALEQLGIPAAEGEEKKDDKKDEQKGGEGKK